MIHVLSVAKNIETDIVDRFIDSIDKSKPKNEYKIHILGQDDKSEKFYKTKIINQKIRELSDQLDDIIIQTDIDLLVPIGLIDATYDCAIDNKLYHNELRYINKKEIDNKLYDEYDFEKWAKMKPVFCSGCWNGMTVSNWIKSKGYNELMCEWGAEDTEFYRRCIRYDIEYVVNKDYPLVHVNHDARTIKRSKENMEFSELYPDHNWLKYGLPEEEKC